MLLQLAKVCTGELFCCLCVYLSVYLNIYLLCIYLYTSIYYLPMNISQYLCFSAYLLLSFCLLMCIRLSICLLICVSVCLSIYLSICVCPSVCRLTTMIELTEIAQNYFPFHNLISHYLLSSDTSSLFCFIIFLPSSFSLLLLILFQLHFSVNIYFFRLIFLTYSNLIFS